MNQPDGPGDDIAAHAYDVAVIGGGAVGLSAAVALGRFTKPWSSSMTPSRATLPPAASVLSRCNSATR